jgi:hypothetical protein
MLLWIEDLAVEGIKALRSEKSFKVEKAGASVGSNTTADT